MDALLERLCQGQVTAGQLPAALEVWRLEAGFDELRRRAAAHGVEWGSCIIWEDGGLALADPVAGWPTGVSPACPPPVHVAYVGFAHVHLPDPVTGKPYMGFSDRDFRATLADGDKLSLVTNGGEVFALVRTEDATLPAQVIGGAEFESWELLFQDAVANAGVALDAALWQVNRELCRRLGFAFYRGLWGERLELVFRPFPRRSSG